MRRANVRRRLVVLASVLALPVSLVIVPQQQAQAQTPGQLAEKYTGMLNRLEKAEGALRTQANAARNQLTVGTAKWRSSQHKLTAAKKDAKAKATVASTAKRQVENKRRVVAQLVASTYQSPVDSSTALASGVTSGDPLGQARGMADVDQMYEQQVAKLENFEAQEVAANVFKRQAKRAERKATQLEAKLQKQTTVLRTKSKKSSAALSKAANKVESMTGKVHKLEAKERKRLAKIAAKKRAELAKKRAKLLGAGGGGGGGAAGGGGGGGNPGCHKSSQLSYSNGLIPRSALCVLPGGTEFLRADAARAFYRMNAAYQAKFGSNICITDAYRPIGEQQHLYAVKPPGYAAVPGTSNHGRGQAVDLGCGINSFGSPQHNWMRNQGQRFGWIHPAWARGSVQEAWHFEYG